MRIDDYLSTIGVIKRRTVAKEMGDSGLLVLNGRVVKPSHLVLPNDIIQIKGSSPQHLEVLEIPKGSVPVAQRGRYFRHLTG